MAVMQVYQTITSLSWDLQDEKFEAVYIKIKLKQEVGRSLGLVYGWDFDNMHKVLSYNLIIDIVH